MLGLTQWVRESTFVSSGNILDLVLTTEEDRIGEVSVLPPFPHCQHSPVYFEYVFQTGLAIRPDEQGAHRLWFRGKYDKIAECLRDVDWDFEFSFTSVEEDYSLFLSLLHL